MAPTEEEMKDYIKQLESKLKITEDQLKDESKKSKLIYCKDRKFDILNADTEFEEWAASIQQYVDARFMSESEKVLFILEHVEKKARTEIRFMIQEVSTVKVKDIIVNLRTLYAFQDTLLELQQRFYSRQQSPSESMEEYASSLMIIMSRLCEKQSMSGDAKVEMIKNKFAEGIINENLKRELRRLNEERPSLTFIELRRHAEKWLQSEVKPGASVEQVKGTDTRYQGRKLPDLYSLFQKQQEQIDGMNKLLHELKNKNFESSDNVKNNNGSLKNMNSNQDLQFDRRSVICYYCKKSGHVKANCLKLNRRIQQNPTRNYLNK